MEPEGIEQEILLEPEMAVVGAVYSVNGQTGHVVLTTSDLENTSDYQTGEQVAEALSTKQDTLTAGNNIQISENNVISATDTTYSAGNGLNLSDQNAFSINTTVVATQNDLSNEVTNRENADIALQGQIDAISASSDVVDIVGTYQELQNYDTSKLKDNDIIKVLQDSTQNNATTYYRWSTSTNSFTLIGQEGPYYTKASADAQFVPQTRTINSKPLSANITLTASDVSALGTSDIVQTTGSSTSQVMSQNAVTTQLNNKLNISDYVVDNALADSTNPVQNRVLNNLFGDMPSDFFSGDATSTYSGTNLQLNNFFDLDDVKVLGDTTQQTYTGKNLLPIENGTLAESGLTFTIQDGILTINGTSTAAAIVKLTNGLESYSGANPNPTWLSETMPATSLNGKTISLDYQSGTPAAVSCAFRLFSDTTTFIRQWYPVTSDLEYYFGTSSDAPSCFTFFFNNGLTFTDYKVALQLESGSTPSSFEPYVGGTASPNPDYPQDVNVVTGTQSVLVHGKNLFNEDYYRNAQYSTDVYQYTPTDFLGGKTYIFTAELKSGKSAMSGLYVFMSTAPNPNSAPVDERLQVIYNGYTSGTWHTAKTIPKGSTLYFQFYPTTMDIQQIFDTYNFQLEIGSTDSAYEPFQGNTTYYIDLTNRNILDGTPWRTVETTAGYPKPVASDVTIISSDENNIEFSTSTTYRGVESEFIELPANTTVTVSFTGTLGNRFWVTQYDENKTRVGTLNASSQSVITSTVTTTQDGYITVTFGNTTAGTFSITNIQVEKGLIATSYQPYESYYSYELCKIGTYQDYIYKSGDDWYIHKETNKLTLTGTETWSVSSRSNGYQFSRNIIGQKDGVNTQVEYFCDNFYGIKFNDRDSHSESIYSYSGDHNVRILTNVASTEAGFQTWLSTHNTTFYYILATDTDTQITENTLINQLDALASMQGLDGITYIGVTPSTDLPAILDITVVNANAQGIIYKIRNQ